MARPSRAPRRRAWWAAVLMAVAAGCGDGRPPTYPVRGTVTVAGKPAAGAAVTLHPAGGEWAGRRPHRPFGRVGPDGAFEVATFAPGDGAPAGEYVVTVAWPGDGDAGRDRDRLGGAHAGPDRPNPIRVTVAAGPTDLPPIALPAPAAGPK